MLLSTRRGRLALLALLALVPLLMPIAASSTTSADPAQQNPGPASIYLPLLAAPGQPSTAPAPVPVPPGARRWSETLPTTGAVTVPAGQAIILDVDLILTSLTIDGALFCADRDLRLTAGWVMVHGSGRLQCGTPTEPFTKRLTITLTGNNPAQDVMGMGTKFLGAMGGVIDLHGQRRTSWTKLSGPTAASSSQIEVLEAGGWQAGDQIVIASASVEPNHAELRTVTAVRGTVVTLDRPLVYARPGSLQTIAGRSVDTRAEVGLLTRNILVQGDTASEAERFGGHVMIMGGGAARFDGVQLHRMGQFDRLGRYPFHWHLLGNAAGQYISNSSVSGSFQRGIVVHGTQNVTVAGNVVYNTVGHNYLVEDPTAITNTFEHNLALVNKTAVFTEPTLRMQGDNDAANFWIRTARNTFTGNAAAGSEGNGFWYDTVIDGPTTFRNNVAHSAAARGVNLVFNRGSGLLVQTEEGIEITLHDTLLYQNNTGIWPQGDRQIHRGLIIADHWYGPGSVTEAVGGQITLADALFVGRTRQLAPGEPPTTGNLPNPVQFQYGALVELQNPTFVGYGSGGLWGATDIFATWQSELVMSGARFVDTARPVPQLADNSILHALDDSYLPRGVYTPGAAPMLAAPGSTRLGPGDVEEAVYVTPRRYGMAFLMTRTAAGNAHSGEVEITRGDGLRYKEPGRIGFRVLYGEELSYRLSAAPAGQAYGVRLDLVGALPRPEAGPVAVRVAIPAPAEPAGVFRPEDEGEGWAAPGAANRLTPAASLAVFSANPAGSYYYDPATQLLHIWVALRWVVIQP